jgi:hypothetical protein
MIVVVWRLREECWPSAAALSKNPVWCKDTCRVNLAGARQLYMKEWLQRALKRSSAGRGCVLKSKMGARHTPKPMRAVHF